MPDIARQLRRAFAHNDYDQARPLYDALAHGFAAVEVDVFLADGELRIGHGRKNLRPGSTLESLYLDPLSEIGETDPDRSLLLLIDVKSDAAPTYDAIHRALERYQGLFTQYRYDGTLSAPVEVVVSGHTDLKLMESQLVRYATADARVTHLEETLSPVVTMVSAKWGKHFRWLGEGSMRGRERDELKRMVTRIHDTGCAARFWGTGPKMWSALLEADVDLIMADDLPGLRDFLVANDS